MKSSYPIKKSLKISVNSSEKVLTFVSHDDGKSFELLDRKLLRQLIPGYGDLNQNAKSRALKKLLKGVDSHQYQLDTDVPPFSKKILVRTSFGYVKNMPTAEELKSSANALLGLAEVFEDPIAGSCLLGQILIGFHADKAASALGSVPALAFQNVRDDVTEAIEDIFRTVAPGRKENQGKLRFRRLPVLDFRDGDLTTPVPLDLAYVKIKGKRGTKVAVPVTNIPVLLIGGTGTELRQFTEPLGTAAVTYLNCAGHAGDTPTMTLNNRDLVGFDPIGARRVIDQAEGIGCVLRSWWKRGSVDWQKALEDGCERGSRYHRLEKLRSNELPGLYELVVHSFIDFLVSEGIVSESDGAVRHEALHQRFHPIPVEEPEMLPPTFDDKDLFLGVVGDILAQNGERIMGYDEKRQPTKRPVGGWRTISGEHFLVLLEKEFQRLYPKMAKARGVPVGDFQNPNWLTRLQKAMGQAGVLKLPSKGCRYHFDLVGRGRDNTPVLAIHAELLNGEIVRGAAVSASHSSPTNSPNNPNGKDAANN